MNHKLIALIIYVLYELSYMFMFVAFGLSISSLVLMLKDLLSTRQHIQYVKSAKRVPTKRGLRCIVLGYVLPALMVATSVYFGHILVKHIAEWIRSHNIVALLAIQVAIYGPASLALYLLSRNKSKRMRIASILAIVACITMIVSWLIQLTIYILAKDIDIRLVK